MNDELLAQIEREVLGMARRPEGEGRIRPRRGRRHRLQVRPEADRARPRRRTRRLPVPREVRDELIRSGRAIPHPAFPDSRTTASFQIQNPEDVPGAIELFRMGYERAVTRANPTRA